MCPMQMPAGPVMIPHVGGPIMKGMPTVVTGGMPQARSSDISMCVPVGIPDMIQAGSPTVMVGNMPAARMGDATSHGGVIQVGCPTVIIGGGSSGGGGAGIKGMAKGAPIGDPANEDTLAMIALSQAALSAPAMSDPQAQAGSLQQGAKDASAFCQICQK